MTQPPLKFSPFNGRPLRGPAPAASEYRMVADVWHYNPWEGTERHADDVARDPQGLVMWAAPEVTPMEAAPMATPAPGATPAPDSLVNTLTERGNRYGKFTKHAEVTQRIKDVIFQCRARSSLAADQVEALEMIAHKIGRIVNGDPDYADSWVDIAGYAKLVADRLEGTER